MKNASSEKVFKACLGIGIDVSKVELAAVGITSNVAYLKRVSNDMEAIKVFIEGLHQSGYRGIASETKQSPKSRATTTV